ncbi:MAG: TolC family protein [Gemmatimonadota bacterium]
MTDVRNAPGAAWRLAFFALTAFTLTAPLTAQQPAPIELTLDRMVELALKDSYRVRQLLLDIDRTRALLQAERAGLKSRVDLTLAAPELEAISDYKWNSTLQRNELIHENTRRWEADLSIRQPVILFGYPTGGALSLNNKIYRYSQLDGDERDAQFYNRYFVAYEQPLFQPNRMKNDLEQAQLELESSELEFQGDIVEMVNDLAEQYFELFESAYQRVLATQRLQNLEAAVAAAGQIVAADSTRAIELEQIQVALANAREDQQSASSSLRLQIARLKQNLRLTTGDSIALTPVLDLQPITIDEARAIEFAVSLAPRMRELAINRRENEIRLAQTRGNDSFRVNLELTYGREVQDPRFENLWTRPRNSYTINVDAQVPLWDWGERKHRIRADQYSLQRTDLSIQQTREEIATNVRNELLNLKEFQQRALNMQSNLSRAQQITATTLARYGNGEVTLVDVLQTIERESDTAENRLEAYLGYQEALIDLQQMTYYDFERGVPLIERFRVGR